MPCVLSCRNAASGSGDPHAQLQGEAHVDHTEGGSEVSVYRSESIPEGRPPAKSWSDVVIPPPLPAKARPFTTAENQDTFPYMQHLHNDLLSCILIIKASCQSS